jgi:Kdo2-lipid IVA lauroyltransferase/acyltransferase
LSLFGALGSLVFAAGGADRRRTIEHLRLIYGRAWSEERLTRTAREVYVCLGKNLFDAIRLPRLSDAALERLVTYDSLDTLFETHRRGRGPIVVTAHTGCFEMLLPFFTRKGIHGFAIGQRLFDRRIDDMVRRARTGPRMEYISRDDNPREIIRRLRSGMSFGVLIDQDTAVEGVFAHFMGRLAYTPSGPVRLAMRLDMPLFVATTARQADDTHHVFLSDPLQLATGGQFEDDLVRNVEMVNEHICRTIRRYPEQWVWMHRRWRRRHDDPRHAHVPSIASVEGIGAGG